MGWLNKRLEAVREGIEELRRQAEAAEGSGGRPRPRHQAPVMLSARDAVRMAFQDRVSPHVRDVGGGRPARGSVARDASGRDPSTGVVPAHRERAPPSDFPLFDVEPPEPPPGQPPPEFDPWADRDGGASGPSSASGTRRAVRLRALLRDRASIQDAVVLREVLGPPRVMRSRGGRMLR